MEVPKKIKLTYFDSKGRAEPARLCFFIGGIEYEDDRFPRSELKQHCESDKFKYKQVPVLEVDGVQYQQSKAINAYAAKLAKLYPTSFIEQLRIDQILFSLDEIQNKLWGTLYIQEEQERTLAQENLYKDYLEKWLGFMEKELEINKTGYYIADSLSLADLVSSYLVQFLTCGVVKGIEVSKINNFPMLLKNSQLVEQHPMIQKYREMEKEKMEKLKQQQQK